MLIEDVALFVNLSISYGEYVMLNNVLNPLTSYLFQLEYLHLSLTSDTLFSRSKLRNFTLHHSCMFETNDYYFARPTSGTSPRVHLLVIIIFDSGNEFMPQSLL